MDLSESKLRMSTGPAELLVHDGTTRCPYLPAQTARLPLRLPLRRIGRRELSRRLRAGDRRQGVLLYRPACPDCRACEAIRVEVAGFAPTRTQRRILRRGDAVFETEIGRPRTTAEKVALYNRHKVERGLLIGDGLLDEEGYEQFLVETCTETIEIAYRRRGALVGIAVADRAEDALSAVYCFYDPHYASLSPGAYSILKQIELCRAWGLRHLYLGLYVGGCRSMRYKAAYLPHERLIGGSWRRFEPD
jgi:arginyl-tRNA--protein-N-Asp/Glu arginylyltransferase